MRLLFDHNLSPRLVARLIDLYSDANHVSLVGLDRASDREVWDYAASHDCVIVTKDSDFDDLSLLLGFPPKVIWLRIGNCTTSQIETISRHHHPLIVSFGSDASVGVLVIA
jgi:predicted nuclease of predicted toxin-antitoxin system